MLVSDAICRAYIKNSNPEFDENSLTYHVQFGSENCLIHIKQFGNENCFIHHVKLGYGNWFIQPMHFRIV